MGAVGRNSVSGKGIVISRAADGHVDTIVFAGNAGGHSSFGLGNGGHVFEEGFNAALQLHNPFFTVIPVDIDHIKRLHLPDTVGGRLSPVRFGLFLGISFIILAPEKRPAIVMIGYLNQDAPPVGQNR